MTPRAPRYNHPTRSRLLPAFLLALAVHAALFAMLAWHLAPSHAVRIVGSFPLPGEVVEIPAGEGVAPIVYFDPLPGEPADSALKGALIERQDESGAWFALGHARLCADVEHALCFLTLPQKGEYRLRIPAGAGGVVEKPYVLSGAYEGAFPTGEDGQSHDFSMRFTLKDPLPNMITQWVNEEKAPEPAAQAPPKAQPVVAQESPPPASKPVPAPPKPPKAAKPAPSQSSEPAVGVTRIEPAPEPPKVQRPSLAFDAKAVSLDLALRMDAAAQAAFEERDVNAIVEESGAWSKRINSAYQTKARVGAGASAQDVAMEESVATYIALMHGEIHPLWAHTYLVDLDLNPSRHDRRAQNPEIAAVTEITLDSMGKVMQVTLVRSSGVQAFDAEAIMVSWKSSPREAIPDVLKSPNGKAYIHWTFWRDMRQCGTFGVKAFKLDGSRRESIALEHHAIKMEEQRLGIGEQVDPVSKSSAQPVRINPLED